MLRVVGKIFLFVLFFNYIYGVHYRFSPLSTNALLGVLGLFFYVFFPKERKELFKGRSIRTIIYLFFPVVFVSIMTILFNGSSDLFFIKWSAFGVLSLFGALLIAFFIKKLWGEVNAQLIVTLMVLSAVCQLSIALAMWVSPPLFDFLFSITYYDEIAMASLDRTEGSRLLGFGLSFFTSGVIHGLILILMSCSFEIKKGVHLFLWTFYFIFITAVGMMMARTTIIGALIALSLLLFKMIRCEVELNKVLGIIISVIIIIFCISSYVVTAFGEFETIFNFGFQMFISKQDTGEMQIDSWDSMTSMYRFPADWDTWLIGDARWMNEKNTGYYMGTDIGFIRMIYYFGLIGLFAYVIYNVSLMRALFNFNIQLGKLLFVGLFLFVCIVNGKGFVDIFQFVILFYFCGKSFNLSRT